MKNLVPIVGLFGAAGLGFAAKNAYDNARTESLNSVGVLTNATSKGQQNDPNVRSLVADLDAKSKADDRKGMLLGLGALALGAASIYILASSR